MKKLNIIFMSLVAAMAASSLQASDSSSWFEKMKSWAFPTSEETNVTKGLFSVLVTVANVRILEINKDDNANDFVNDIIKFYGESTWNGPLGYILRKFKSDNNTTGSLLFSRRNYKEVYLNITFDLPHSCRDTIVAGIATKLGMQAIPGEYDRTFGDSQTKCQIIGGATSDSINCEWNGTIDQVLHHYADAAEKFRAQK